MSGATRRNFLTIAAASATTPAFTKGQSASTSGMIIDGLCLPGLVRSLALVAGAERLPGDLDTQSLGSIRASDLTAINATVSAVGNHPRAFNDTLENISWFEKQIAAHSDTLLKITRARDLETAKTTKKLGVIYGFQDTYLMGPDLDNVRIFAEFGVRVMQLTYNMRNLAGDGSQEPANAGLSVFGRKLIEEINHQKVLLDLSHGGARTIIDAIEASKAPMAITHSGCRTLVDVARNVDDNALRALAEKGGVFGVYCMPFLRKSGQPHAEDVIAHIEHAINVCGEDHVGFGTDGSVGGQKVDKEARERQRAFVLERRRLGVAAEGEDPDVFNIVPEYNAPDRYKRLANDLRARGHPARRVEKILGDNFARLFRDVWPT